VPAGLHQDEMSEAYESYSLLHTGADRWGYHLPAYFLSWGSGQNVMQAYLTIPVVAVLGLTRLSARLVPMLCNLAVLPLFFYTMRRWYNENTALLGLLILVFSPWHIMLSRIGIENAPVPFFLLLGLWAFGRALDAQRATGSTWRILLSLLPFAGAMYTYGVMVVITPIFVFLLLLLVDLPAVLKAWRAWLAAVVIACVAAAPVCLFTLKNFVTKHDHSFEKYLPFTAPLLPVTRLEQSMAATNGHPVWWHNLHFIAHRLSDRRALGEIYLPWFQIYSVDPVQLVVLLLAVAGIALTLWRMVRLRRMSEPFFLWIVACLPLIVLVPLNISRAIAVFVALMAMAAYGGDVLFNAVENRYVKYGLTAVAAVLFFTPMLRFVREYYGPVYAREAKYTFNPELPDALATAQTMAAPSTPIFVTPEVWLNYVQVLFLTKTDPHTYQTSGASWGRPDFGPYRFSRYTLSQTKTPFVFLIKAGDVIHWEVLQGRDHVLGWDALLLPDEQAGRDKTLGKYVDFARRQYIRDDPMGLNAAPICPVPTDVARVGQFIVGRCP
jgi:4-amino-4-deoxy-L-arabinose transferase-like glycosyltransferase